MNAKETKAKRIARLTEEAQRYMGIMCWARGKRLERATLRYFRLLEQIQAIRP